MKVLFLSTEIEFAKTGSAYGYRLDKLREAIEAHGVQTDFLSLRQQPLRRPVLVHPLNLPFLRRKVADFDFIHAGGDAAYTAAFLKPYTKAKVIHDVHGDTLSEAQLEWKAQQNLHTAHTVIQAQLINAIAYRRADYSLVVSKPLQQRLIEERRVPAHTLGLIRNGVDLDLFKHIPHQSDHPFTVCYAGGFQPWQGMMTLVQAFALLVQEPVRLKIIGFTPEHAALRAQIAQRLGDQVELVERVSQPELVKHLRTASILVSQRAKHRATAVMFPCKFSEFLALGKPVIVCDVDETADFVRQYHCGLVSKSEPAALAETIWSAAQLSQAELAEMGQNARRLAEREFSWHDIGREYVALLETWSRTCAS